MLKIILSKPGERFLKKLGPKQFFQIDEKIMSLSKNPKPNDSLQLKGFKKFYRVDVGEYRIIYKITETHLIIDLIGKRNDREVYKKFVRLKSGE
jgi:mRNA interferase RelE/StbE